MARAIRCLWILSARWGDTVFVTTPALLRRFRTSSQAARFRLALRHTRASSCAASKAVRLYSFLLVAYVAAQSLGPSPVVFLQFSRTSFETSIHFLWRTFVEDSHSLLVVCSADCCSCADLEFEDSFVRLSSSSAGIFTPTSGRIRWLDVSSAAFLGTPHLVVFVLRHLDFLESLIVEG